MSRNRCGLKHLITTISDIEKSSIRLNKSRQRKSSYIHTLLDEDEWNLTSINDALKTFSSSNEENEFGETPLIRVLEHESCSLEVIDILLQNGADVNLEASCHRSPLISALVFCKQEKIIERLMNAFGDPTLRYNQQSLLCIAVECCQINIIHLLLRFECPLTRCKLHDTALHCALSGSSETSNEAFKLFLEKGMKEKLYDEYLNDILCLALNRGEACHIKLLLEAGASLDSCTTHKTSLFCVGCDQRSPLRADVVKILLEAGLDVYLKDENDHIPLQKVLYLKPCEADAIKMFIVIPKMSIDQINEYNLLHAALSNGSCKIDVIKVLLEQGCKVNKKDEKGDIPLHVAARRPNFNIIKLLLKYHSKFRASIDVRNLEAETPMDIILKSSIGQASVVMILFFAGAQIRLKAIKIALDSYLDYNNEDKCLCLLLVMKIYILKYPNALTPIVNLGMEKGEQIVPFVFLCRAINTYMDEVDGGQLRRFIIGAKALRGDTSFNLNGILRLRLYENFGVYYDIISARIGKAAMLKKLERTRVLPKQGENKDLSLNYDILSKVFEYVPEEYVLNFCHAAELGTENEVGDDSVA